MRDVIRLTVAALLLTNTHLSAATLYVSLVSTNPTPPYSDWSTAATNIQDAVDAVQAGDRVVVADGVYDGGVRMANPVTSLIYGRQTENRTDYFRVS